MIEDIRRRRQERIREIISQEQRSSEEERRHNAGTSLLPVHHPVQEPPSTRPAQTAGPKVVEIPAESDELEVHPSLRLSELELLADSTDPERMWKASRRQWHERYGWEQERNGGFWRSFRTRMVLSVLLFAAAFAIFRFPADWNEPARQWIGRSLTEEMDMRPIAAWYEQTFSGSPSFIPLFQGKRNDTASVQGGLSLHPPVKGTVLQPFDMNRNGIRIAAETGTEGSAEVVSVATGRVTEVNRRAEDDIQITVQHASGVVSIYGGLAASEVKVNDWLEEGEAVGTLGSPEGDRAAALYFALLRDGEYIDPTDVIAFD
ncbi:M23 family metallopeptidase [Paenibacillus dendritiformis]|uniref:M23 family metallopeptidase n=1 Tax=Paenibacillus dendritiformis TaxID=130049 RepID=UPI00143D2012|nr:M23 family metallopeptidase [Paenibacillus dendritiformis]NKI23853.1 M23 family metallopeptidase [Paenibacillus dendritiformis]NRF97070.1 M23 family metallopeptidase [Paenibacillus dendritiformis]